MITEVNIAAMKLFTNSNEFRKTYSLTLFNDNVEMIDSMCSLLSTHLTRLASMDVKLKPTNIVPIFHS